MVQYRQMMAQSFGLALAVAAVLAPGARAEGGMTGDEKANKPAANGPARAAPRAASPAAPHMDFEEVLRREYEAALAKGTDEALALFIARHPKHKLADQARAKLVRGGQSERPDSKETGPDAAVLKDFTRATRVNSVAAYDAFISRHPRHPLAEEARRMRADAKIKSRP
ncbi:hypothetical protein [Aurantimonas sp. VKM B-3413]|uniref:hypothetical protein n=1 Tax=Aurantimonas sp. VKM B-3413 TaxID=2779401 RepID=UPI001E41A605|nr:hypothetical protein [Aurantimonas sp. VKM B-3413]MCB8839369.1 hypothetical protein [Aurantimonas sp. VKM B-3413]